MRYLICLLLVIAAVSCTDPEPTEVPCVEQVEFTELIVHDPKENG